MAKNKEIITYIKLQVPAGAASPSPPVGPALGQHGVNLMDLCNAFNAQTNDLEKIMTNKVLMICTTFNFPNELEKSLSSIINVLNNRSDTVCTIIDNLSKDKKVHQLLDQKQHNQLTIIKKDVNGI